MTTAMTYFDTSDVMQYMSKCDGRRRSVLDPDTKDLCSGMPESQINQIRIFVLKENDHLEKKLFRLKIGQIVQFVISGSLFSKKIRLFCNHIQSDKQAFERTKYYKLRWINPGGSLHDDSNKYAALTLISSGTFHYYFTLDDETEPSGSGYLLVDPILKLGDGNAISLDSLQCQTVISKCCGPFAEWFDRINVSIKSGFNMIHFTPLQELSHQTNSSYAIHNHLVYNPKFGTVSIQQMKQFIALLYKEHNLMSVTDLVYNHVATGCPLLNDHPEVAYNLKNSPHLKPAFLFDRIIHHFSKDVHEGLYEKDEIPSKINNGHLYTIRQHLLCQILPKYKFHEFVMVDVDKIVDQFKQTISDPKLKRIQADKIDLSKVLIIPDTKYGRMASSINMELAASNMNAMWDDLNTEKDRVNRCGEMLKNRLNELNDVNRNSITNHVAAGVDSCISHCRYWFFESGDSSFEKICTETPLAPLYFHYPFSDSNLVEEEQSMYDDKKSSEIMAFNGWTANNNPLKCFADKDSNVYLRRELIVWSDLIKVRYGTSFNDCPALWKYMEQYTVNTVEVFAAVRLDNCHSTPLHVAEYMLDIARSVKSNLYVFGELFTGSEDFDNIFVNKLGITSLVRESMSSYSPYDFGRQIYRYGGQSVGAFYHPPVRPIVSGIAHAIFYDVTHDNMCPISTHSIYDILPRMFLTNMTCCSTGSSRGYDELVPHHINVVTEERLYKKWSEKANPLDQSIIDESCGIISARRLANKLHMSLREEGFTQIYVDQVTSDVIAVTRHNPSSHHSIVLVARTAFSMPNNPDETGNIRPLFIPGYINEILFEASMERICTTTCNSCYTRNPDYINGLPSTSFKPEIRRHLKVSESKLVFITNDEYDQPDKSIEFKHFTPGCVIAFRVSLTQEAKKAVFLIRTTAREFCSDSIGTNKNRSFQSIISDLTLVDINTVLYRCSAEEIDDGNGSNVYNLPNYGNLVYSGLQGIMSIMEKVRLTDDMGHPICENLRNGNWILEYIGKRLVHHDGTQELGNWFLELCNNFQHLPRFLVPSYFDAILTGAYTCIMEHSWNQMPKFIQNGSTLLKALSMVSVQLVGHVQSSLMPSLSLLLPSPKPAEYLDAKTRKIHQLIPSLSAGLEHFCTGAFRNWGRDTFISLRGLLLLTGRYQEARYIILSYGQCMRNGLIPNLLGSGVGARYNCRDAFWWWLYSIKCYVECVDKGFEILNDPCAMMYPTDESAACEPGDNDQELFKVIHLGLRRHVQKMRYRERGAGFQLDNHMSDEGFNVEIGVDTNTGFVYGGNSHNCGTWMDKMGGSEKAGNRGIPATPRDGSAVEIVGLSKSCIDFLITMNNNGHYPFKEIDYQSKGNKRILTLSNWSALISENFEKHFWIDEKTTSPLSKEEYINRKGIYKDSVNSSFGWTDYQFRPNFLVALVVAPQLCNTEHAWTAICKAEEILMGRIGMKTLDFSDLNYVPDYDNSNDSCDKKVAHGWGYHQGPEWLWLTGYLYRAMLNFANMREKTNPGCTAKCLIRVKKIFGKLHDVIMGSDWKGLPELTNSNGVYCPFSCETQAWSAACLLELMQHVSGMAD